MDEDKDCGERIRSMTPQERARKVIITVSGGVAAVLYCPPNIAVEIRDYDNEAEDPLVVSEHNGTHVLKGVP